VVRAKAAVPIARVLGLGLDFTLSETAPAALATQSMFASVTTWGDACEAAAVVSDKQLEDHTVVRVKAAVPVARVLGLGLDFTLSLPQQDVTTSTLVG